MKKIVKPLSEYGPLVIFFAAYKTQGIIFATGALVAATIIATAISYAVIRTVAVMPLIAAAIVAVFGGLTVFSGDDTFIKIKPTLVNLVFAVILFVGLIRGKGLLKYLLENTMQMSDNAWRIFSMRWAIFFLILASANEIVWRNFSTDIWVNFKVFGMLGATFIFMLTQVPFIQKNLISEDKKQ